MLIVDRHDPTAVRRKYYSKGFSEWMMRFGVMPAHPTFYVRRRCYEEWGDYSLKYKVAADFEFFFGDIEVLTGVDDQAEAQRVGAVLFNDFKWVNGITE